MQPVYFYDYQPVFLSTTSAFFRIVSSYTNLKYNTNTTTYNAVATYSIKHKQNLYAI